MKKIARALISVADKQGIVDFARTLSDYDVEILSTGGTAATLRAAGIAVVEVSEVTGFPEILAGRVKTLHPKIYGGILAQRDDPTHQTTLSEHNINYIDLVVVNLYPFLQTIAQPDVTLALAIENIDIGGPAMIRAAAKNFQHVGVIVDIKDYDKVSKEFIAQNGALSYATRATLAAQAFAYTAHYDLAINTYLSSLASEEDVTLAQPVMPQALTLCLKQQQPLRYGENPHQAAAFYRDILSPFEGLANALQLQGKELSFNNLLDLDAAWALVSEFSQPACVIVKHTNPCGVALAPTPALAFQRAYATDPTSAFGGILAFNTALDAETADHIAKLFVEVIVATDFHPQALQSLNHKKNLRLIKMEDVRETKKGKQKAELDVKRIYGGYLIQEKDSNMQTELKVVTKREPSREESSALDFAWKICQHVKSNAIVYTNATQLIGVGAGQMSRIDAVKLAASKATLPLIGTVMASDAFFPFRDGIDLAAKNGITAVIQPGGSLRDEEVIAAANEHSLAMVFTAIRHFKH